MANGNGFVQRAPLPPLNSPTITEADRARVYGAIGKELNNILNGSTSYHPDSVKKSSKDLRSELDSFVDAVRGFQDVLNDPANIVGDAVRHLEEFQKAFGTGVSSDLETMWNDPEDERDRKIKLPDQHAPNTRDNRVIDPESELGPFSVPNPLSPNQWRKDLTASTGSPDSVATSAALSAPPRLFNNRVVNWGSGPTSGVTLGGLLNNANASNDGDWAGALVRPVLRNSTQPEPPRQTADSIPDRRLGRRTYSVSPASVFDTAGSAVPFSSSNGADDLGGVLGRFALVEPEHSEPLDDDEEQTKLRALDEQLSRTGNIRDAVALYMARKASRR
jgi:hypothetical protein